MGNAASANDGANPEPGSSVDNSTANISGTIESPPRPPPLSTSLMQGVVDMISDTGMPSPGIVSRYQQISGHIAAASAAAGTSVHGNHVVPNGDAGNDSQMYNSGSSAMATSPTQSPVEPANPASAFRREPPQVPLRWPREAVQPSLHLSQNHNSGEQSEQTTRVATLIEWRHGGYNIFVEGSWDDWSSRDQLQNAGKDFVFLKFIPPGVYHYRFVVDGEWRHAPDLPHIFDAAGNGINVLDLKDYVPDTLDGVSDFDCPSSPESSYDNIFPGPEDYTKDPPSLPSQLSFNSELESAQHVSTSSGRICSIRPHHVVLNHLFVETRKAASKPILTLGITQRFRNKYVTVILHKPLKR